MTLTAILAVWAVHLAATVSPGPAFVVAVRTAVADGPRVALPFALGIAMGGLCWAIAALSGLHLLFLALPAVFALLKFAGAAFLILIAIQTWRHAHDPLPVSAPGTLPRSAGKAIRLGLLTQFANPKTALFFGAVFAGLVPPGTPLPALALILGLVFLNESFWFVLLGLAFSRPAIRRGYARLKTTIDRSFGALMAALGIKVALT